jgi:regulator of cell morphogenesis and NO signaling
VNLCEELTRDHDRLRAAFAELRDDDAAPEARRAFAADLRRHARREDELLFAELEPALSASDGPLAAMRAEHAELDRWLDHLAAEDTAVRRGALERLERLLPEHFLKEERVLFAFAERLLDAPRLAALGALFREDAPALAVAPETRVADLARAHPGTIRVFQRHAIDFCCGGKRPLAEACEREGVDYGALAAELEAAVAGASPAGESWDERPTVDLVGHILARFHSGLRDELARLEAMAVRARERHGENHPELIEIAGLVSELRSEMVPHLEFEERELFPLLLRGETRAAAAKLDPAEEEHRAVGELLARLRAASGGYRPPAQACNTWRGLFHGLAELERETHLHVHVENNVLFPRVATAA